MSEWAFAKFSHLVRIGLLQNCHLNSVEVETFARCHMKWTFAMNCHLSEWTFARLSLVRMDFCRIVTCQNGYFCRIVTCQNGLLQSIVTCQNGYFCSLVFYSVFIQ